MKRSSQHEKKAGVYRGLLKIGHKRCFSRGIIRNGINFQVCNLWYFDKKPLVDKCWHSNAVPILRQSFVKLIPQKKTGKLPCFAVPFYGQSLSSFRRPRRAFESSHARLWCQLPGRRGRGLFSRFFLDDFIGDNHGCFLLVFNGKTMGLYFFGWIIWNIKKRS